VLHRGSLPPLPRGGNPGHHTSRWEGTAK
jgi:hypothetical protein